MLTIEHKTLRIKITAKDLDLDLLADFLSNLEFRPDISVGEYSGALVKAGLLSGLLVEPAWTPDQVGKQKTAVIRWIANKLVSYIGENLEKLGIEMAMTKTTLP